MREPDIPFRQFDFIKDSAYLQVTNPEGVCEVLVAEWLAGGGALGGSTFRRRGRGFKPELDYLDGLWPTNSRSIGNTFIG